jgi:hypothetical protein
MVVLEGDLRNKLEEWKSCTLPRFQGGSCGRRLKRRKGQGWGEGGVLEGETLKLGEPIYVCYLVPSCKANFQLPTSTVCINY